MITAPPRCTAIVPEPPLVGRNKRPGKCCACGGGVPAGAGNLYRGASGWLVYHQPGQCSAS